MKTVDLKLLEFLAITVPVAWWWNQMGGREATWKVFLQVSAPILAQMGVLAFAGSLVKDRLLGVLPFVALMVITPGIPLLRKAVRTVIGLFILYYAYVFLAYWAWYTHDREGVDQYSMSEFFPVQNMVDALPFVLWAIFAREFVAENLLKYMPAAVSPAAPAEARGEPAPSPSPTAGALGEGEGEGAGEGNGAAAEPARERE